MAEPTGPAHLNHRPYDATIAGVVRLLGYALLMLGCDASIVPSAVPIFLIASVRVPCDPPSERIDPRAVYVAETDSDERTVCVMRLCRSTQLNVLEESTSSDVHFLGLLDIKRGIAA